MNSTSFLYGLRYVITFIVLYQFSLLFLADPHASALSTFFPAPAFILAISFIQGLKVLPLIYICATLASFFDVPPWELTSFNWLHILRQTLTYGLSGIVLKWLLGSKTFCIIHVKTLWPFIITCLVSTLISSMLASALFYHYGFINWQNIHKLFISFFIGDFTGLLMFTLLAFWLEYTAYNRNVRTQLLLLKRSVHSLILVHCFLAISLSAGLFILVTLKPELATYHYLLLLPVTLISAKYGLKSGITTAFIVNLFVAFIFIYTETTIYTVTEIQTLFAVIAFIALLLGTYYDNQKISNERLRNSEMMLANLAQKSSLSELGATIAHEVASPLQAALTTSQLSIDLLKKGKDVSRSLLLELNQDVAFALSKAVQIHHRIYKGILAKETLYIEEIILSNCVNDALRLLNDLCRNNQVQFKGIDSLFNVIIKADRLCMTQVFINLIKNAIQADATYVEISARTSHGYVEINITNNGKDIDNVVADRIFDSLFTTKKDGFGLGLSVCRTMLEGFGGKIKLIHKEKTHHKTGATFQLYLPTVNTLS
ncbi:ATP-binding protein [uncultured Aliivibrio sp.]|uniref:ATP-binding protein n=1 Tax=uncultured Aliivibrio sp. TaxID=873085 RepID=UPI0026356B20|nr:ATP-binding protein [uncultured Aliivibrio sp.]